MEKSPYLTLKLQLYPNGKMKHLMDRSIEISGYVYNAFIYVGRYYRKNYNRFPSKNDLRGLCTKFWKNCPWMHDVANNCFFECADNAIRSLKTCQENYKRHRGDQLPKYRKREDFTAFGHISCAKFHLNNTIINGKLKRTLHISKIGDIRARNNQDEPPGMPKTCHIRREMVGNHHEYFATISYCIENTYSKDEINLEYYKREPQGIDIGISNIATLSNGIQYPNKKFQKEMEKQLAKYHRQLSTSSPFSKKFKKIRGKLSHLYLRIRNKRRNYTNEIAKEVVYRNNQLFAENISINELRNIAYSHDMRQQYNDACLSYLLKRLEILTQMANRPIEYVDCRYSSQECNVCGKIVKKKLETRTHVCPECGLIIDRDQNAAKNLLKRGMKLSLSKKSILENTLLGIDRQSFQNGKMPLDQALGSNACLNIKFNHNSDSLNYKSEDLPILSITGNNNISLQNSPIHNQSTVSTEPAKYCCYLSSD